LQSVDKYAVNGNTSWTDYYVEAVAKPIQFNGSSKGIGLAARYTDDNNNYRFFYSGGSGAWKLTKTVSGTGTVLDIGSSKSIGTGTDYTVKLEVDGTSIKGYVNGNLECEATDSSFTSGKIALQNFNTVTRYDNVEVYTFP